MNKIEQFLEENSEKEFAKFQSKLIFSTHKILGVRTPLLRKFAKKISPDEIALSKSVTHEEILLYGFSASKLDEEKQLLCLKTLLPYIDNWATCDQIVPSLKKLNSQKGYQFFMQLLLTNKEFYVRVGLIGLMRNFLKSDKMEEILEQISKINCDKYYVNMAIAWFYAELCASNFALAKKQIENAKTPFIKRKAISKACESFRLSASEKEELKLLLKKI